MLVSRWVYDGAVYGGLVAAVASAWFAIRHRERQVEPKIPPATTGRSVRRYIARIAPVIVLIALIASEWALLSHAHDAVIVDPGQNASRAIYVGADVDVTNDSYGTTLVVNRSEAPLRFIRIDYGDYQLDREIPPGTASATPEIDFIGPEHQPPTDPGVEHRTWLTWD